MKTENIVKAADSAAFTVQDIRAAHSDAVKSSNGFAEVLLFEILQDAVALQARVTRAKAATYEKH